ncbi:uncharacterized membrane protein At1g75140-like [Oryza brachyantha]|uniref:uncharacterized membrane protein At1g75140-like n=1 Tax=Oryza brachyantha TaxID=4533 RepID=UPI001ADC4101|nr:uncharacterized membrane protein At1g75140-like [Oryza brachyantha]
MPHHVALLLLTLAAVSAAAASPEEATGADPAADLEAGLLVRHEAQLARLEELTESLAKSVQALESALARSVEPDPPPPPAAAAAAPGDRRAPQGVAVTKRRPYWSERFHFAAAARLGDGAYAAAATALPYEDADGLTKYFAVGDSRGRVFVFSAAGDALLELEAGASGEPPVTALLAYLSPRRTDCFLFAGHADGSIAAHRLIESSPHGDDWLTLAAASSRLLVRGLDAAPVLHLEAHHAGRARYVLSCDSGGRIRVFTENGTLYGTAIASSTPLAFVKQRLLFLTEAGAASLDLRSMSVRETPCEGLVEALNGSLPKAYSFDPSERFKAYGFTDAGDLVHVLLLGDIASLKCRVRAIKKAEIDNPVSIQTTKGYLLVASQDKVLVYNTSTQYYGRVGAPRPLFGTTIKDIKSVFAGSSGVMPASPAGKPLIAADREKLVILGLGDGYIAIYRSNFPVYKPESNAVVWSGPALLFLLFLIGIWQVYVKKKDSLGWTPEETFNTSLTAPTGSILNHSTSDRAFADSSTRAGERGYVDGMARASDRSYVDATTRATDRGYAEATRSVDIRGGALRGAPRRYPSPTRYSGGGVIPYRPVSTEPVLRATPELKYRGPGMEPPGFPKKRDTLFSSNQTGVDDHVD